MFVPAPCSALSLCDYMFPDESTADVAERLKEMLDWDTPEGDIDISLEANHSKSHQILNDTFGVYFNYKAVLKQQNILFVVVQLC